MNTFNAATVTAEQLAAMHRETSNGLAQAGLLLLAQVDDILGEADPKCRRERAQFARMVMAYALGPQCRPLLTPEQIAALTAARGTLAPKNLQSVPPKERPSG